MTLARAYRETTYRAGPVLARVGRRSPSADAWLAAVGARQAAMITAWNPMGRRHPRGWNARAQARLRAAVRRWVVVEGVSGWHSWHEHNLLITGDHRALAVLARRFRQAAMLVLRRGQAGKIVWLG
jgi:hypothetical protein